MSEAAALKFRSHTEDDIPFILDSWGSSYYQGSLGRTLSPDEFHHYHRPIRQRFFKRPDASVLVCCPDSDPWVIIGWIALEMIKEQPILHYIYVKEAFKKEGIATQLFKQAIPACNLIIFSHLTFKASLIMGKNYARFNDFKYIPHLV